MSACADQVLREQLMDELMEGRATVSELSVKLGAPVERITAAIWVLEGLGLVRQIGHRSSPHQGRPQILYDMVRTIRGAA